MQTIYLILFTDKETGSEYRHWWCNRELWLWKCEWQGKFLSQRWCKYTQIVEVTIGAASWENTFWSVPKACSSMWSDRSLCYLHKETASLAIQNAPSEDVDQGPVVQSVISLTSLLRVISLTVLPDSIYTILMFFAEKMSVAYCKSYSHFFSKKFQHICVSLDVNFNESLTNDVVCFEQLGPDCKCAGWSESSLGAHVQRYIF